MGEITAYSADGVSKSGDDLHAVTNAIKRAALEERGDEISRAFNGDKSLEPLQNFVRTLADQIREVTDSVQKVNDLTTGKLGDAGQRVKNTAETTEEIASRLNRP